MNPFRRTWNSLQARLLIGAALWIVTALAVSDVAISALFRQHVTGQFLHELNDHGSELQGLTQVAPGGAVSLIRPVSDPRFSAPGSGFYWQIRRPDGAMLRSPSLAGANLPLSAGSPPIDPRQARMAVGGQPIMLIERDQPGTGLRFAIAAESAQLEAVLGQFSRLLRLSLIVLALGLMVAATAQVAFGLRPMRRLRQILAQVRTGQAERLPDDFPSEVRPLVSDLNGLILSNQEMVRRARAQAGNLAHALKGPLAILTDEAERLAERGDPAAAAVVRRQCEAMSRQIDHQLARARASAARSGPGAQASASDAAGEIISAMVRLYGGRDLTFENALPPDLIVGCDREDLREILANLIDNAAKWAVGRVRIRQARSTDPAMVALAIEDDGPGIAPDARTLVFSIGARLDEQKPGAGLGLAIVHDLTELYGGGVRLDTSAFGGLAALVELPRPA